MSKTYNLVCPDMARTMNAEHAREMRKRVDAEKKRLRLKGWTSSEMKLDQIARRNVRQKLNKPARILSSNTEN